MGNDLTCDFSSLPQSLSWGFKSSTWLLPFLFSSPVSLSDTLDAQICTVTQPGVSRARLRLRDSVYQRGYIILQAPSLHMCSTRLLLLCSCLMCVIKSWRIRTARVSAVSWICFNKPSGRLCVCCLYSTRTRSALHARVVTTISTCCVNLHSWTGSPSIPWMFSQSAVCMWWSVLYEG